MYILGRVPKPINFRRVDEDDIDIEEDIDEDEDVDIYKDIDEDEDVDIDRDIDEDVEIEKSDHYPELDFVH